MSPKFGISWYAHPKTTIRGAYFYRLSAAIGRFQTLEPTQVAGFNQFFGEPGGTRSRTYGVGIDQQFSGRVFGGLSGYRRDLDIPEASCAAPDPTFGCAVQTADSVVLRQAENTIGTAYLNTILSRRLAFAIDYTYEKLDVGFTEVTNTANFVEGVTTHRVRPELRWFLPSGWFAGVAGNYFNQEIELRDTFDANPPPPAVPIRMRVNESFWTIDARIGYRLPLRYGSVVLEGRNLGDRAFENFQRSIEDTIIPAREILLSLQFTL